MTTAALHGSVAFPCMGNEYPDKWVCVGKKPQGPKVVKIYNEEVLLYRSKHRDETLAVRNVCPHRGARLSHNCTVDADDCVRCAYHGMHWGERNNADNYMVAKEDGDLVWVNAGIGDGESTPPTMPEFAEDGYRTFSYSAYIGAHPMIVMENLLDHAHLQHVHKVKIVDATNTKVSMVPVSSERLVRGKSVYSYPVTNDFVARLLLKLMPAEGKHENFKEGEMKIWVENEFVLPYTSSLRFMISGHEKPPFVLWFSVLPFESDKSLVTCRVSRNLLTNPAWDGLFWILNLLPLKEDDEIVRNVMLENWWRNRLMSSDAFVKLYRTSMKELYGIQYPEPFS